MTNKWYVNTDVFDVVIQRIAEDIPIATMCVSSEAQDGLLEKEPAADIAQQIVDDWNFSCDELEECGE